MQAFLLATGWTLTSPTLNSTPTNALLLVFLPSVFLLSRSPFPIGRDYTYITSTSVDQGHSAPSPAHFR